MVTDPLMAVVFDLDGTLLDHEKAQRAALFSWLGGYSLNAKEIEELVPVWFEVAAPTMSHGATGRPPSRSNVGAAYVTSCLRPASPPTSRSSTRFSRSTSLDMNATGRHSTTPPARSGGHATPASRSPF